MAWKMNGFPSSDVGGEGDDPSLAEKYCDPGDP
jgi:hypothetical protein